MHRWSRILHDATHSRRFLWRLAFGLLTLGIASGYLLHRWHPGPAPDLATHIVHALMTRATDSAALTGALDPETVVLAALDQDLNTNPRSFDEVLDLVPQVADWAPTARPASLAGVLERHFTREQSQLAGDLLAAVAGTDPSALERLRARVTGDAPAAHAAHALGLALLERREYHGACLAFTQEGRRPDATRSRRKAIACLLAAEDFARLRALEAEPDYAEILEPSIRLQAAIHERNWPAILRLVPRSQYSSFDPAITALALIAGLAWAFVLLHLGHITHRRGGTAALCGLALIAGVASTTPTIYAVIWQDDILGLSPDGDALRGILFYIGAVGVREEVCKLALFLPFLPVLLRRGDELEALTVASFVGLGFAMEENGNYFLQTGGMAAAGRFLTANFFHIVLTGMNGLALHRALARRPGGANEFLTVFGATILAHGGYNALLSLPGIALGGYLAMAVFVVTCRHYFVRAHSLREPRRLAISLSGTFVAAVSTLAAAMIVYQMMRLGPVEGLEVVLPEFIGAIVLLVMFFREFDEPLAA